MKKRWTALLLALTMTLALTACGGEQPSGEEDAQESVEETVDDAQTETGEDMTETGTEEAEDEQAQEPQLGEQPADTTEKPQTGSSPADTNEKPQSQPVEKPSTEQKPAQEQKPAASADLSAFAADLAASQTNWPGMMALEGEALDTYYPGLSALSPKQCVVQMAMISASAVEIALVEVASSADVETVKGIFQSRIDYQLGDGENPGGLLYPASVELWQNNARIVSNGNYVMLVVFENADGVVDSFNAQFA
ncbi:DUF4358 domain-containing protein [Dysosmobacter sp. Phy]